MRPVEDYRTCGFCGQEFDSMSEKIVHQNTECEEIPRTKVEE